MARIAGVNIPVEKNVFISLTYIYGIGMNSAKKICLKADIDAYKRVKTLSDDEIIKIREVIDQDFIVEGNLRRERSLNIKKMMALGSYRGLRHRRGLPVRGQSTHSNARTRKGVAKPIKNKK